MKVTTLLVVGTIGLLSWLVGENSCGASNGLKRSQLFSIPQASSNLPQIISRKRIRYSRSVPPIPLIVPRIQSTILPATSSSLTLESGNESLVQKNSTVLPNSKGHDNQTAAEILRAKSLNRVVRQLGILERLSCLPKLLCGLETKEPSTKTTALNDYGALVKLLFGREDDYELDDDDDDEQNDEESGRTSMDSSDIKYHDSTFPEKGNGDFVALHKGRKGGKNKYRVTKNRPTNLKPGKTNKNKNEDESDESGAEDEKDEKSTEDYAEFDEMGAGVLNWKDMAQEELLNDEPEMLTYALMKLREEFKRKKAAMDRKKEALHPKKKNEGRTGGDAKDTVGTSRNSTRRRNNIKNKKKRPTNPGNVKYQIISPSAQVQSPYDPYPIQYPESYVPPSPPNSKNIIDKLNKNIREKFGFGFASDRPQAGTVLETLLPSSIYQKFKSYMEDDYPIPIPGSAVFSSKHGHFGPGGPYVRFPRERVNSQEDEVEPQRVNSKFRRLASEGVEDEEQFMFRQARQLESPSNGDPLEKYRVALATGQRTKSARQCRLLFSRCPYRYSEIKQLIDNAKEFLDSTATVGDKVVPLKKKKIGAGTISKVSATPDQNKPSPSSPVDTEGVVHLLGSKKGQSKLGGSGSAAVGGLSSFGMQQLPNGDLEIKLKVKPKQEAVEVELAKPILVPIEKIELKNNKKEVKGVNITALNLLSSTANWTVDDLWGDIEVNLKTNGTGGNGTGEPMTDKAFAPTKQRHDLLGIDYPPDPSDLVIATPVVSPPTSKLRSGVEKEEDEDVGSNSGSREERVKMRQPSHLLPPLPSSYKIVRQRMGRPRSVDAGDSESRDE